MDGKTEMNPATLSPAWQIAGKAFAFPIECGTRKAGYYTAYMIYVGGWPNPHTGPVATREEADKIVSILNKDRLK
jgi:hypothetical protein